jgi:hypothetical protein
MKIWKIEGTHLAQLREDLNDDGVYCLRVAVDGNHLKLKLNQDMWSLGVGYLEVPRPPRAVRPDGTHDEEGNPTFF